MRILVVYCHPVPDSFGASLRDTVVQAARAAGHSVDLIDLYAEGFEPVMRESERRSYHSDDLPASLPNRHVERLRACDGVILVYPTWWMSPPAMLKGWFDRIWRPGVAFANAETLSGMKPLLTHIRLIFAVSTLGAPWWYWTFVLRNPGRNVLLRSLKSCCNARCKTQWLSLHNMDSCSAAQRARFLSKVAKQVSDIR